MNRKKVEEYSILLKDSAAILQADTELWKQFLHFATQFTHYRFRDQLLIYAQNPISKSTGNCLCDICPVEEDWTLCQEWRTQYCVA